MRAFRFRPLFLPLLVAPLAGAIPVATGSAAAAPAAGMPPTDAAACPGSGEFGRPARPLERVAATLAAGQPLHVLAVGSATTAGDQPNGGHIVAFPERMADALRREWPKATITLTVQGRRGLTAPEMLALIRAALAQRPYSLVIWQTGTVEAVRGLRPDALRAVLEDGIRAVHAGGGDVVLIDPQYSRFLRANTNLDPYETVLQQVATQPGVAMFHRFELTRIWALDGRIDLERVRKAEREGAMTRLHDCLGNALAEFIANGVTPR